MPPMFMGDGGNWFDAPIPVVATDADGTAGALPDRTAARAAPAPGEVTDSPSAVTKAAVCRSDDSFTSEEVAVFFTLPSGSAAKIGSIVSRNESPV